MRVKRYPEAADGLTDGFSGEGNRDFSALREKIGDFVTPPDDLPYGVPLETLQGGRG
jgi:hypothetical protein